MNTEDTTALAMVRLGYALDDPTDESRCLNFRVGFTEGSAAAEACLAIEAYNEFEGTKVVTAINRIIAIDRFARIYVGREGSPVLYVTAYGKADQVMAALKDAGPDELDLDGSNTVRAWWD